MFYVKRVRAASKDVTYPTKWPYPGTLNKTDWSKEVKKRPVYHSTTAHREIDAIFTKFLKVLSRGDKAKKEQLTLQHEWFPMEAIVCFDQVRDKIKKLCVDWTYNPYVQKFSYIVINICNADWLKMSDIENCIMNTCTTRLTTEDVER